MEQDMTLLTVQTVPTYGSLHIFLKILFQNSYIHIFWFGLQKIVYLAHYSSMHSHLSETINTIESCINSAEKS